MKDRKLLFQNPVLLMTLGVVPALAASTDLRAALGMSAAVMFVLLCSALVLGLLRKLIPAGAKLPAVLLTVAGFAAMAQMLLHAFLPSAYEMLGSYAAILGVDLMLFGSTEDAADFGLGKGMLNALECGFAFAVFTLVLAAIREFFGSASLAGHVFEGLKAYRIPLLTQAPGGLIVFSILLAVFNKLFPRPEEAGKDTCAAVGIPCEEKEAEA